jgi:hypothetical protein
MTIPMRQRKLNVEVAHETGPLDTLAGRSALILVDDENLRASAKDLGFLLSYRSLVAKIGEATQTWKGHIFFSREANDDRRVRYFEDRELIPHPRDIHEVQTGRGVERTTNSDFMIAFHAGMLVSRSDADLIVIASGDGKLVWDISEAVKGLPKQRGIMTMSLAGSTAWRLNAATNRFIDANMEIGLDCLRPIPERGPSVRQPRFSDYETRRSPQAHPFGPVVHVQRDHAALRMVGRGVLPFPEGRSYQ